MPRTITRTVKSSGGDYNSLASWVSGEARDLTKMRGFLFGVAPTTLVKDTTYTFSNGWQGKFKGTNGASTLGRFEEVTATTLPGAGATVSDGTNTYTVSSVDYSDGEVAVAECYAFTDTSRVDISGFSTDSTRYITVRAAVGAQTNATWRTSGVYSLKASPLNAQGVINISVNNIHLERIQIESTSTFSNRACISVADVTGFICDGVFAKNATGSAGHGWMYASGTNKTGHTIQNCIAWNCGGTGFGAGQTVPGPIYNSNAIACGTGISVGVNGAVNCVTWACTTGFSDTSGSSSNNASGDATAQGANSHTSIANPFTNTSTGDFTLVAGASIRDQGITVAGFSTDIAGTTRPQGASWDIGAFEYVVTSGGAIVAAVLCGQGTWIPLQVSSLPGAVTASTPTVSGIWTPNNTNLIMGGVGVISQNAILTAIPLGVDVLPGGLSLPVANALGMFTGLPTTLLVINAGSLFVASTNSSALSIGALLGPTVGQVSLPQGIWTAMPSLIGLGGVSVANQASLGTISALPTSLLVGGVTVGLRTGQLSSSALATLLAMGATVGAVDEAILQGFALPTSLLLPGLVGRVGTAQIIAVPDGVGLTVGGISVGVNTGRLVLTPLSINAILGQLRAVGQTRIVVFSPGQRSYLVPISNRTFKVL